DDEKNMRHMLTAMLSRLGYRVETAEDGEVGLEMLSQKAFEFVLCDIKMPVMDGMEFLRRAVQLDTTSTIIMMSAFGTIDTAIEAMQLGAYDYISKPFKADEIQLTLKKAEERESLRKDNSELRKQLNSLKGECNFANMVAKSRVMKEIFRLAVKVAQHPTSVLITGASGTGKELLARGIHKASPRATKPFIAVNCGGIPENLLESELFGYKKGAFTGADRNKKGLFVEADRGTLFLDEIGELPLAMQVKLLRVVQEQEVQPLGAAKPLPVNVRLLAATARDLADEVKQGRFREDLLFRLNVINIHIPSLSKRLDDLPLLCNHFIEKLKNSHQVDIQGIAPAALNLLLKHSWLGNVRELENVIERAVILAEKRMIMPENLPPEFGINQQSRRLDDFFSGFSIKKARKIMEKSLISRALEATGGNKSKAAELLEISYPALLQKIKSYSLN
ncbi:MAG: response regulator, partial [Desulfobulbaceae bacterium]|nr:response regulator [Desulfobulbaceae bacterium]